MRVGKIENGVVTDMAVATPGQDLPDGWLEVSSEDVRIGWTYSGGKFKAPPEPETGPPTPEDINAERERRLRAGVSVTVDGLTIPVQGRAEDQINLLALDATAQDLIAAGITEAVVPFRDAENFLRMLTPTQVREVARQGKAAASQIYAVSWAMKDGTADFTDGIPEDFADDKHWP